MSWNPLRKFGTLGKDSSSTGSANTGTNPAISNPSHLSSNVGHTNPIVLSPNGSTPGKPSFSVASGTSPTPPINTGSAAIQQNSHPTLPPGLPVGSSTSITNVSTSTAGNSAAEAEQERIISTAAAQLPALCDQLQNLEKQCKAISRLGKRLSECVLAASRYQCKLSEELASSTLCQQHSEALRLLLQDWHTFNVRCSRMADERAASLMSTLLDPLKQLALVFTHLRDAARKQQRAQAELGKWRQKLNRAAERERTAANLLRLEQAKQQWKRLRADCAAGAEGVLNEMQALADTRIQYVQPSLEALVKAELLHWAEALRAFTTDQPVDSSSTGANVAATGNAMAGLLSVAVAAGASPNHQVRNSSKFENAWDESGSNEPSSTPSLESHSKFSITKLDWNEHSRLQRQRLDAISQLSIVEGVQ